MIIVMTILSLPISLLKWFIYFSSLPSYCTNIITKFMLEYNNNITFIVYNKITKMILHSKRFKAEQVEV